MAVPRGPQELRGQGEHNDREALSDQEERQEHNARTFGALTAAEKGTLSQRAEILSCRSTSARVLNAGKRATHPEDALKTVSSSAKWGWWTTLSGATWLHMKAMVGTAWSEAEEPCDPSPRA